MSKAEKVFEELNYNKSYEDNTLLKYIKIKKVHFFDVEVLLVFNKKTKDYEHFMFSRDGIEMSTYSKINISIDVELHQAIHEQLKELGWLDE